MMAGGFEPWVYLAIGLPPLLIIMCIVYFHAESRGENGLYWAIFCALLPGLGFLIYFTWAIMQYVYNRKQINSNNLDDETPDMSLSKQRFRGRGITTSSGNIELDNLIQQGFWEDAEVKAQRILEEAEEHQDGQTIAKMIGYLEKIRKRTT